MKNNLIRLDKLLVKKQFASSRTIAQTLIQESRVYVNGITAQKSAAMVSQDAIIKVDVPEKNWVSRGAYKLLKAMEVFSINADGKRCIDIGASTGGFTEVLLFFGAEKVYSIDVGYGQFAWKLRTNNKVKVMERTNARNLTIDMIDGEKADIIVSDASFISVTLLLPVMENLLKDDGLIVLLVKPQFEAGRERVGHGVITNPSLHIDILNEVINFIDNNTALTVKGIDFSPIKGPEGNIEFLFLLKKENKESPMTFNIPKLVEDAHAHASAHPY